jgi:hypothetical protein
MEAYLSEADVLFYGGSAGGGKTDLEIGLALTQHQRSIIFRREAKQLQGIFDRLTDILGSRDGFNGHDGIWRLPGRQIEFGSCKDAGSETAYQGRPHDLKCFDEITLFLEKQFRFLNAWLRTTKLGQRCRVVCTGNPPTDSDGEWVVRYWAPWLDPAHPKPAKPGELRWFAVDPDGNDIEVPDGRPFFWNKGEISYDITPEVFEEDIENPHSRTFIPSRVTDNVFLMETGYRATLQALPEPLRSQMLHGDFMAGRGDDPWQVIPTEWVRAAQARWQAREQRGPMDAVGVDVARGGRDKTIIARRHGNWYDELITFPGTLTPDGPTVAGQALMAVRNGAPIHVDVIGVGASVYDFLNEASVQVVAMNASEASHEADKTGTLPFFNKRAEWWWRFREALDPTSDSALALPPDDELRADLTAPRWKYSTSGIQVESKLDIVKRIQRSPDRGDAVIYAHQTTIKRGAGVDLRERLRQRRRGIV